MTSAKTRTVLAVLPLLAVLLGACTTTPVPPPAAPSVAPVRAVTPAPAPAPRPAATPMPAPTSPVATVTLPAYLDPKSDISTGRSVYFDFDASLVRAEFTQLLERHGKFLIANPKVAIKIEGHTDQRGSHEYNLALGQRRAQAVMGALKAYGVKPTQMEAVSWGEEKPKATGNDESAWAQNRRADLAYPKN